MSKSPTDTASVEKAPAGSLDRMLLNAFLESIPDRIYFKDRESRFIAASVSQAHAFGRESAAEIIGRTDFDFFDEAHARPAFEDEQRILRTGEPVTGKLEKETWPDGHVTWALSTKLPLRDDRGTVIGTFGISKDVTSAKQTEIALERAQRELVDASRTAGMAEVATGVLHNVGNVLNSLNISASVIVEGVKQSKAENLARLAAMLREHAGDLANFLLNDPKGKRIPDFIDSLAQHAVTERERLVKEAESFQKNVDHIKEIVAMQQAYATIVGITEPLDPASLMEDALRMNAVALARHSVNVVRSFQPVPPVLAEKGKVLQILVNLIQNAKYAADGGGHDEKIVTLAIEPAGSDRVRLLVRDNGVGIAAENLSRIFTHGFTTRAHGHGFGLHSSITAASEMNGTLTVQSDGPGKGATFTLELPAAIQFSGNGSL